MKNEITFKKIDGITVTKLRGGRVGRIIKDKTKYCRKTKYKGARECYQH